MSIQKIFIFAIIAMFFTACGGPETANNAANSTDEVAVTPVPSTTTTTNDINAPNAKGEAAQNSAGVWHYTCSSGCEGGAGTAMPCPKCGTTLVHNTTYHNNGATTTSSPTLSAPPTLGQPASNNPFASPAIAPVNAPVTAAPPRAPEPPQNAKGVWHYTCPKGCAGGGGSATACSGCGETLAHNTAYH